MKIESKHNNDGGVFMVVINDGAVVMEHGPRRKKAIATEELLDDKVTSKHYQVGKPDALNKPIKIDQEMAYIDWRNRHTDGLWYVYQRDKKGKMQIKGDRESYDEALSYATKLAA